MVEFVKVTYTGKEKSTGRIFDTNDKKAAEAEGIYNPKFNYKPVLMILGKNQLIKGFEEALEKMKTGEEKTIELPPEKAYGERKSELIKLVPLQIFKSNKINPVPGMILELEGAPARVQSVSSGRVRVDFNNELAGKTLIFKIKLEEKIEEQEDKVKALIQQVFPLEKETKIKINGDEVEINLSKQSTLMKDYQNRKMLLIQQIKNNLEYKNIKIIEEYWLKQAIKIKAVD